MRVHKTHSYSPSPSSAITQFMCCYAQRQESSVAAAISTSSLQVTTTTPPLLLPNKSRGIKTFFHIYIYCPKFVAPLWTLIYFLLLLRRRPSCSDMEWTQTEPSPASFNFCSGGSSLAPLLVQCKSSLPPSFSSIEENRYTR